jgi:hypothetical protein
MRLIYAAILLFLASQTSAAEFEISREEQAILELTNAERQKEGAKPFKAERRLFIAARAHSENMARQQSLSHSLDGKQPWDRVEKTGYSFSQLGENVAFNQKTPKAVLKSWMDSPGHRENILNKKYTEIGIGIAKAENGELYYTQVFAKPMAGNADTAPEVAEAPARSEIPNSVEKSGNAEKELAELKAAVEELKKSAPESKVESGELKSLKFEIRNASGKTAKITLPGGAKVSLDDDSRKTYSTMSDNLLPTFEVKIGKQTQKAVLKNGAIYKIELNDGKLELWMKAENASNGIPPDDK